MGEMATTCGALLKQADKHEWTNRVRMYELALAVK